MKKSQLAICNQPVDLVLHAQELCTGLASHNLQGNKASEASSAHH
jgi:hypothetical protein